MELAQKHLALIKQIIQTDKKYQNNEDLFDDFYSETCKRALSIVDTLEDSDDSLVESYLKKVASTAIVVVLKSMGRIRRTNKGYVNNEMIKDIPLEIENNEFNVFDANYNFINIKSNPEEIALDKEQLQSVYDAIIVAHSQNIEKQFLQLYELRYVNGYKQSEIAKEMNISQPQVSKRLFELIDIIKKILTNK